jgi:hypothetical protein
VAAWLEEGKLICSTFAILLPYVLGSLWGAVTYIVEVAQKDLVTLKDLAETGKLKLVIDRRYPLSEATDAIRYRGTGRIVRVHQARPGRRGPRKAVEDIQDGAAPRVEGTMRGPSGEAERPLAVASTKSGSVPR